MKVSNLVLKLCRCSGDEEVYIDALNTFGPLRFVTEELKGGRKCLVLRATPVSVRRVASEELEVEEEGA